MKKMDFLIEFIVTTVLVGFIFAASLTFKVPDSPLIVQEGEDAVLLCLLPPDTNAEEMEVRWYRELDSLVHSYMIHRDVIEAQSEQYRGRTSLSQEELKTGNVSLQLREVRSSDEGSYSCCVLSAGLQCAAEIQLKVVAVFAVEVPAGTVSALVGEDTVLPCQLNPGRIAVGMKVRWSRDGSEAPVLCYQRGEEVTEAQHEDYRHRAQLPEAELSRGNVSLLLSSTRVTDQGTYTCSVSTQSRSQQAAVQLQLTAKGSPPSVSLLEAPARGGHCLLCVSEGWYPPPELLWTDERGSDWTAHFNSTEELDSRGLVTVRSQIHLPWQQGHAPQQQNTITCVVRSKDGQIELKAAFSDSSFSVEVPVALVSACVGDTVTLPCRLSPLSSAVLMEKAMTSVQSEEYRDRTRLFMEELRNGNLSLQLDNTQTSDSGLYKCSVSYNLKEAEAVVELKVAASVQNEKQTLNEGCESCKKLDSELQRYKEASVQTDKELANNGKFLPVQGF
ncbi:UNVERIFIED_CONTAM: hypothetical protein FKN15_033915 [Acipenser sinensis]